MFYVYIHYRATDGSPFYVGKGKGNRFLVKKRTIYWNNIANKNGYFVEKIEENLTEEEALRIETYWIWQLRSWGFKLANQIFEDTKRFFSSETLKRMSDSHKGQVSWNTGKKKIQPLKCKRAAEERICLTCENKFLARKDKPTKFCTVSCSNNYNRNPYWGKNKKAA